MTAESAARAQASARDSGTFLAVQPVVGPPEAVADPRAVPSAVFDAAANTAAGGSSLGAKALEIADTQKGVREEGGANLGEKVGEFQASTGAGPGTAWCASFVTWSLEQAGHKMEGGGWAGVATWVQNAREGKHDLSFVDPEDARPGDLVVYDWSGGEDFGADGHIGFVASEVKGGKFTALEGNQGDMVQEVPRAVGQGGANVKFIRIGADAPAGAPAAPPVDPSQLADAAAGGGGYPGDDAPKDQIAAWMAREAEKRGLPGELPVMAALVESNLANLDHGHSTSLGYFQMLEHLWNKGEYAGYPDKPELQLKWFLDTAEQVKKQRLARGLSIDDPKQFGEWIADVERPAAEYRGRYQLRLGEARGLLEKGAAAPPAAAETVPAAGEPAAPSRPPDPSEYGREGTGGPMTAEVKALLENPKVKFDEVGIKDLKEGKIDPRAIAVLTKLSQDHEITVTCMCSDHPRGPGSNHYYGRGVDIGTIDGEIVRPGSAAARELASEIAELSGSLKPSEVGTPFAIASPGYFTDAAHQDHIHIGWDDPITPDWKPPADVAARASAVPPPGAAAAAPAAGDSGAFMAVTADSAARAQRSASESGAFLAVAQPEPAAAAAAAPPAAAEPAPPAVATGAERIDLSAIPDAYPGDDAPKAQLAAWLAKEAEKRGLPPQLPVMAALVESGVRNLNYGDADSVGFFQMRVGIWNKGEYAGFPEKPELQAKWFLDNAEQVKKQRLAAGKPVDDPQHFGEWIADVERPAEQYRYKYQLRLQEADNLLKQAGASTAPQPEAAARSAVAAPAPEPAAAPAPPPAPEPPAPEPPEQAGKAGDSGSFLAVPAEGRAGRAPDSGTFMAVGPEAAEPEPSPAPPPEPAARAAAFEPDLAALDPDYPGDDAPKEDIARWMAREAAARGIPPELPVMAALVESNLQNLDHGHSTSLGYFQMLEHFWNQGEYAGYPDNPRLQLKWFLDHAEQVKQARVAAGRPVDDPAHYGEWIADVEKPAAEYRGRYQLRLDEARRLLG